MLQLFLKIQASTIFSLLKVKIHCKQQTYRFFALLFPNVFLISFLLVILKLRLLFIILSSSLIHLFFSKLIPKIEASNIVSLLNLKFQWKTYMLVILFFIRRSLVTFLFVVLNFIFLFQIVLRLFFSSSCLYWVEISNR